jgi:hypothetical protein
MKQENKGDEKRKVKIKGNLFKSEKQMLNNNKNTDTEDPNFDINNFCPDIEASEKKIRSHTVRESVKKGKLKKYIEEEKANKVEQKKYLKTPQVRPIMRSLNPTPLRLNPFSCKSSKLNLIKEENIILSEHEEESENSEYTSSSFLDDEEEEEEEEEKEEKNEDKKKIINKGKNIEQKILEEEEEKEEEKEQEKEKEKDKEKNDEEKKKEEEDDEEEEEEDDEEEIEKDNNINIKKEENMLILILELFSCALLMVPLIISFCECSPITMTISAFSPSMTFITLSKILELNLLFPCSNSSKHFS